MRKKTDPVMIDIDQLPDWLLSKFDFARWLQSALIVSVLSSIADIAWEYQTGIAEIYSKLNRNYAVRVSNPEGFQSLVAFEALKTGGLAIVIWAVYAARKSVDDFDIFGPGQEFKSLEEDNKP